MVGVDQVVWNVRTECFDPDKEDPTEIKDFAWSTWRFLCFSRCFHLWKNESYFKVSFRLRAWKVVTFGGSLAGSLKSPTKIGWYFLKMTFDTAKFLSNNSIFCRNSGLTLDISAHFWALLKNSIRLNLLDRKRRVSETPLPWIVAPAWPTVGKDEFRHATYKAQASQWIWSP